MGRDNLASFMSDYKTPFNIIVGSELEALGPDGPLVLTAPPSRPSMLLVIFIGSRLMPIRIRSLADRSCGMGRGASSPTRRSAAS